ncbi:hypothetical protein WBG78_01370 [Chryseolinea sp. T2]|uniref:hypothetical protein n=1 Tax=Chryseolinea sp. T2 TaxID=3129255 RepID=UPI003077089C
MEKHYHLGLLCFVHLLIKADGVTDQTELEALEKIKEAEHIPSDMVAEFERWVADKAEPEIYRYGLSQLRECTETEKLRVFAILYKLSEIDGRVHTQELRMLLYSVKTAGVAFNEVVDFARSQPRMF